MDCHINTVEEEKELIEFSDNDVTDSPNSHSNSGIEARNTEIHMRTSCNSVILNSFLKLLVDENNKYNDASQLMVFDSFFLSNLRIQGPEAMENEVKNLGLFLKADILVFPVHIGLGDSEHWGVLLAYPKTKLIRACDPLGLEHREELYMLLGFLEYMAMKNDVPFSRADWTLKGNPTNLPKQECSIDCGFCVCYYVDAFSKGVDANTLELPSSKNLRKAVQSSLRRGHTRDLQEFAWAPNPFQEINPYLMTYDSILTETPWLNELDDLNTRDFTKEWMGGTMKFLESTRKIQLEMAEIELDDYDLNFVQSLDNDLSKGNVSRTKASDVDTVSMFHRCKEQQDTGDDTSTSGWSNEPKEEGNENSVIITGSMPTLAQMTGIEIDEDNLPCLENMENISPGGKLSLDTDMFCEDSLSIIPKNKDPQKMEWSVDKKVNEADGEAGKIALKIAVTKPFFENPVEKPRGHPSQRMKRLRKWIRQPDGTVKRVNVRKLGYPVFKPFD